MNFENRLRFDKIIVWWPVFETHCRDRKINKMPGKRNLIGEGNDAIGLAYYEIMKESW